MLKRYFLEINDIKIYPNNKRTHRLINKEIESSNNVCILTMFGQRTFDMYPMIWNDKNKKIEIIISNINSNALDSLVPNNSNFIENIKLALKTTNEFVHNKKEKYSNLRFYTHNVDLPFNIIILDESIYIKYPNISRQYNTVNVSRYGKESDEFYAFKKYYKSVKMSAFEE